MTHHLQTIEDAVETALFAPLDAIGVRTIKAYAGELDVESVKELASSLSNRLPAVFIAAESLGIEPRNRVDIATTEIHIACCTRHLRGPEKATRGDATPEPGIFEVLETVEDTLNGANVVPGWAALAWAGVEKVIRQPNNALVVFIEKFRIQRPVSR